MTREPWIIKAKAHPGSTLEEIQDEPSWEKGHSNHRIGFKNRDKRFPGYTSTQPLDLESEEEEVEEARDRFRKLEKKDLVNFRDVVDALEDFHLLHPEQRSKGWRYVLEVTEEWVKYGQDWPANRKKKGQEKEDEENRDEDDKKDDDQEKGGEQKQKDEESGGGQYSKSDAALLDLLKREKEYMSTLLVNDGTRKSPQSTHTRDIAIDQADQFTPDNWFPRSPLLQRLAGTHPMNAEPPLTALLDAGTITPNDLHYVRNHGPVPRLLWEFHEIDVGDGKLILSMDDLVSRFRPVNIPIVMACDGNRRGEMNKIRMSKGFSWGAGGVGCAYWKGPQMRDVLLEAGIVPEEEERGNKRLWVNFEGADDLSEGRYATCIPLDFALDETNDVLLAYEMNDQPLPPDHGYPVRVMIPGYVGGRCVKWLRRIWISEEENDSHYHVWDNRVLPSFVTDGDGEFAHALFRSPDTACTEQNLNSVIVRPAHGEKLTLSRLRKDETYRIEGFAYNGGGRPVQRVEVSLDGGESWRYCPRRLPEAPIRHGSKFWTWAFWHIDVHVTEILGARSVAVRCFDDSKNTQPEKPNWNLMGMMNNCWYQVKKEVSTSDDEDDPFVLFRHPVEIGKGTDGWMRSSVENEMATMKTGGGGGEPQKRVTRKEVEKHDREDDCWIVVNGNVYDATSVLSWHPGGSAPIMNHAGVVHQATTDEFESIHDDYARQKMQECLIGKLTDKALTYLKKKSEKESKDQPSEENPPDHIAIQEHLWRPAKLLHRKEISPDTRSYTFQLPLEEEQTRKFLGMATGQHIEVGFHLRDKMITRPYTPTRPILPSCDGIADGDDTYSDGKGTFELTVKTYFPSPSQPGGAVSNLLDKLPLNSSIDIRGPLGSIRYLGRGHFCIDDNAIHVRRVSLVLGGSGITPGYSIIARACLDEKDETQIRVVDANKTENDILMHDELDEFEKKSNGKIKVTHVLEKPEDTWKGLKGFVTAEIMKEHLFGPDEESLVLVCGPPVMIAKAVLPGLKEWGYEEDKNLFGF